MPGDDLLRLGIAVAGIFIFVALKMTSVKLDRWGIPCPTEAVMRLNVLLQMHISGEIIRWELPANHNRINWSPVCLCCSSGS